MIIHQTRIIPTPSQIRYLEILFNDLSYSFSMRNAQLSTWYKRPIKFLDDLSRNEAGLCIERLKGIKENLK